MTEILSKEQEYALAKFRKGENLFITGPGGAGKSRLIFHMTQYAKEARKSFQVCALTGCAAVLLKSGGKTIHSWSGIKIARGPKQKIIDDVLKKRTAVKKWRKVDILIIDEVSMMSEKIFDLLDTIGKITRGSQLPFGGIQMVFSGDFFQLPPVGTYGEPDTEMFCFESSKWLATFPLKNHIELETIFRQTDPVYINILSQIRRGYLDPEYIDVLKQNINRTFDTTKYGGITPTKLFPIKVKVDHVNKTMFEKIDDIEYELECSIKMNCLTNLETGKIFSPEIQIKCDKMTETEKNYEIENMLNNTPCERELKLKIGANVLCTVNIDMDNGICNGSQGKIIDIKEIGDKLVIIVRFTNGITRTIEPHFWQSDEFPCIAVGQYPLMLAWALTIHKIQGATLSMAEIDIGKSVFEYGQSYVALSRVKSLDGLYLSAFDPGCIRANPKVINFYNHIPKIDYSKVEISETNPFKEFELKEETYEVPDKNIKIIKL
jgi:ATP-dependent DNA helicase PIF1